MSSTTLSSDIVRGHIDTIILSILFDTNTYGYQIIKMIAAKSNEQYFLKEATMYSSLKRLEAEGCVLAYWGDETQGGRRKYYSITPKGKELYETNKKNWQLAKAIIDTLI